MSTHLVCPTTNEAQANLGGRRADAVTAGHAVRAFLVLGGDGWKLRDYFTSGKLSEHLIHAALVRVVTLEAFIRLANNGQL